MASSGLAPPDERPRCSPIAASSAACPASKGEGAGFAAFVFAVRFGESAGAVSSSAAAAAAAEEEEEEEEEEGAEEAGELSPQSRNPISVCAAWRIIIGFYLLLLDGEGDNIRPSLLTYTTFRHDARQLHETVLWVTRLCDPVEDMYYCLFRLRKPRLPHKTEIL